MKKFIVWFGWSLVCVGFGYFWAVTTLSTKVDSFFAKQKAAPQPKNI